MIDGICIATNKHPSEDESKRLYYLPGQKIPGYSGDLCARLKAGFLKLDIDDFDHKTGEIDDPVQSKPRSEAVRAWLDSKNIRYNLMITEHPLRWKLCENSVGTVCYGRFPRCFLY